MQLSLVLTALALSGGVLLGAVLAVMRLSPLPPVAWFAAGYVNAFRSIPLILVLFWFYFLVPLVHRPAGRRLLRRRSSPSSCSRRPTTARSFAPASRAFRAARALPAMATGMTQAQVMRHVVLPQAFRNMTPVMLTQAIILFQDTSLVYVVTLHDFMTSAASSPTATWPIVEVYIFAACVYFVVCFAGSRGSSASAQVRLEVPR